MTRGIYFLANDRSLDNAIALVNSIRAFDDETPLMMIPYAAPYAFAARTLTKIRGVSVYGDSRRAARLMRTVRRLFGPAFFPRPDNLRKQLCWFGPFDEFLYLDADIIVFEKIIEMLDTLRQADFLCYSDQHESGIMHVFKPSIIAAQIFPDTVASQVFNAGFWGARTSATSETQLYTWLEECARDKSHLDRSQGGSDQPVFNYFVLKHISRRVNLYVSETSAGMWAGRNYFERRGDGLFDPRVGKPLPFLHWAGIRIEPRAPYYDVWRAMRLLNKKIDVPLDPARGRRAAPRWARVSAAWQRSSDRIWNGIDRLTRARLA